MSVGIVIWSFGFLTEMLSPEDSPAEGWGYVISVVGIFVTAHGAAAALWRYL